MIFSEKLVERYREMKVDAPDCLLLMQVGAFMHVMNEDAKILSGLTGLKLKVAGTPENPCVTGGFPKSGLDSYFYVRD